MNAPPLPRVGTTRWRNHPDWRRLALQITHPHPSTKPKTATLIADRKSADPPAMPPPSPRAHETKLAAYTGRNSPPSTNSTAATSAVVNPTNTSIEPAYQAPEKHRDMAGAIAEVVLVDHRRSGDVRAARRWRDSWAPPSTLAAPCQFGVGS